METILFVETILSEGAIRLRDRNEYGVTVTVFQGINGKAVHIITSDPSIPKRSIRSYLTQLGMSDIADGLLA
jgi:hypothetical protein